MPKSAEKFNIAVVGATGAVGREFVSLLEQRAFPVDKLRLFASPRSLGKKIPFKGTSLEIELIEEGCFKATDFVFFTAGKERSLELVPQALQEGALVIDSSSAFRRDNEVPLLIPEINGTFLEGACGIIASPNCVTTMTLLVLAPLHRRYTIKRAVVTTYQAASGLGNRGMEALKGETHAFLEGRNFSRKFLRFPYAFNLFLHDSPMSTSKYNEEEEKILYESRKILREPYFSMAVTCVRVPILRSHSIALNVEFEELVTEKRAKEILSLASGIEVFEDWERNRFPMPIDSTGRHEVLVGRIREDCSQSNTLDFWVVGDQLLKGAALNLIQIGELISKRS